jgi:hypothetical protein
MHTPSRRTPAWGGWAITLSVLAGLQACTSPHERMAPDPQFGQTVRSALQAQTVPATRSSSPAGVPYIELEQGLDSQRNAKPAATTARPSGQSPSGLFGQ